MNCSWIRDLEHDLAALEQDHLLRTLKPLVPHGRRVTAADGPADSPALLNFGGNDYLALAQHPHLQEAAMAVIRQAGTGAGASRLVTGHLSHHAAIEARFAAFKHAQAALLCPTGLMANLAVLTTLAGAGDLVCLDKLCHASLIDAARASGATVRIFPHLGYEKLERLLRRSRDGRHRAGRAWIVTDSVFSMDGDVADLPRLCELADHHDAILLVDEAHGTGVLGPTGAGLCELQSVQDRVDVVVSTASKALAGLGGLVTGGQAVIATLVNRARAFIYTTGVPPAQAAAIGGALDVVVAEPERREKLAAMAEAVRREIAALGYALPPTRLATPIVPVVVGSAEAALALSSHLRGCGIYAPAIRPPTVAPAAARVRLTLRADFEPEDLDGLLRALASWEQRPGRAAGLPGR